MIIKVLLGMENLRPETERRATHVILKMMHGTDATVAICFL